jgi:2-succinyl-6-hydroxy-2,4-cyclohexadiene-1-carboxylate synthase
VELKLRTWGEGAVPVLWLHGFAGDGGSFDGLRDDLSSSVRATLPDLPGHGATKGPAGPGTGWEETLAALEAVLRALPGPRLLAGYSMGARLALALALRAPDAVDALLLESGTAGLRDQAERAQRRNEDEGLATLLLREGIAAFVARWEETKVLAGLKSLPQASAAALRARRLAQDPRGLAGALRAFGQGVQPPLWDALPALRCPVLVVAGALDDKYAALARPLAAALPRAMARIVEGSGHTPHLERPGPFAALVREVALLARNSHRTGEPR